MRRYAAIVLAVIVGACGGGDDITNPPDGETFTLTVSGEGTGAGQISTAPGVEPAIDCTVAGSDLPAGVCSATYPEGSAVNLTVEPDENSTFDGWSGDATSCAEAATCSVSMTEDKEIVAQFSTTVSADVQVTSSAFYPDPEFGGEGAVLWVAEVQNTGSQIIESARVEFTSHDASGAVLASDFTFVGPIPPGETRAGESFADYTGTEASVEVEVGEVVVASEDPNLDAAEIVSSNWQVDPDFAGEETIIWTAEVRNTTSVELESVQVDFVTYDSSGNIVEYDANFVGPIPPGETRSLEGFADLHGTEADVRFQIGSVF
jgi:hypothetical protein